MENLAISLRLRTKIITNSSRLTGFGDSYDINAKMKNLFTLFCFSFKYKVMNGNEWMKKYHRICQILCVHLKVLLFTEKKKYIVFGGSLPLTVLYYLLLLAGAFQILLTITITFESWSTRVGIILTFSIFLSATPSIIVHLIKLKLTQWTGTGHLFVYAS